MTTGSADRGFVSKYSSSGRQLFRKELPGAYQVTVATDALDNLYLAVSGRTLEGKVEKFSSSGRPLWTKTLPRDATSGSPVRPAGLDLAPDGSVYVAANIDGQPLLLKLRGGDGKVLKTVNVSGDRAQEVRVGGGSVYVYSVLNTPFHFEPRVSRFRPDGSRVWERRGDFGGDETFDNLRYDAATGGISADAHGNVYLTGAFVIEGDGAGADGFHTNVLVRKYTPAGTVAYNRRFTHLSAGASGRGVTAISEGELYVVGTTGGEVNGKNNGGIDAFLTRLNAQGQKVWER